MAGDEEEKKADEDKDLELDLMAEAELLRLTRQYRIMEGDKEAYCEEAQKVLRRQRKILADLGGSTWQNNPAYGSFYSIEYYHSCCRARAEGGDADAEDLPVLAEQEAGQGEGGAHRGAGREPGEPHHRHRGGEAPHVGPGARDQEDREADCQPETQSCKWKVIMILQSIS